MRMSCIFKYFIIIINVREVANPYNGAPRRDYVARWSFSVTHAWLTGCCCWCSCLDVLNYQVFYGPPRAVLPPLCEGCSLSVRGARPEVLEPAFTYVGWDVVDLEGFHEGRVLPEE